MKRSVTLDEKNILIDGKPTQIISGAIHYFRTHHELWRDRLERAKAIGINTVETYFCWDQHEKREGIFDNSGILDFCRFIDTAKELGLYVIVRPGPFICGEWNNGALPPWLCALDKCKVRRMNKVYLEKLERYFNWLLPQLACRQYSKGGNIIMGVVENEYGWFGRDTEYLRTVAKMFTDHGFDVPLVTADCPKFPITLLGGSVPELPVTITIGPDCDTEKSFAMRKELFPYGPEFCMEYWTGGNGGITHCGVPRNRANADEQKHFCNELDKILARGASVNLYMLLGGTNFGFTNGANMETPPFDNYACGVTSYDYDAPMQEWGDAAPKFKAIQDVIRKYNPATPAEVPAPTVKRSYGEVAFESSARLFDVLDDISRKSVHGDPQSMESLGMRQGYLLYRTILRGPLGAETIRLRGLRDRAQVWVDGKYAGSVWRSGKSDMLEVEINNSGAVLDVLVENTGYVNYGPACGTERKGVEQILVNFERQDNFTHFPLEMEDDILSKISWQSGVSKNANDPVFAKGYFNVDEIAETFIKFPGQKGCIWINGFNIGKYWNIGPDTALYVPSALLKKGRNEIVIFEQYQLDDKVTFQEHPGLGDYIFE
ncbi:MAG: beta-galactosidase [Lentisphaeria bacterium]|nr:beta-galactosidase [Lentisphaeria bacterium]